ncbi:hypothetical protein B1B_06949, partial [mine drainage metagenome]
MKLLYLLDFEHFRQTGYSVTGMEYHAWKMGPVPTDLFEEWEALEPDLAAAIDIKPSASSTTCASVRCPNANSAPSTSPGASCASCRSWPRAFMTTCC